MATGKLVWLGDGMTDFIQESYEAGPVPVGGIVTLEQGQLTDLERRGHRFAPVKSDEGQQAIQQAQAAQATMPETPAQ